MRVLFRQPSTAVFLLAAYLISPGLLLGQSSVDQSNSTCSCPCCTEKCSCCGAWFVVETANFQACCQDSQSTAKQLAKNAEALRLKLQAKWLGDEAPAPWTPKCQIVLHPNLASYVAACGRGSEHTVGSSLVKVSEGRIGSRQIDLVGDRADFLTAALPHELTHVVLKDRFPTMTVPRWADEGIAILADSDAKQGRHLRDLADGVASNTLFDTAALVELENYPGPSQIGVFYGQSVSLVKYLVDDQGPRQFVDFIARASTQGYDAALQERYGLHDVGQLDRRWRRSLFAAGKSEAQPSALAAK
jgi:hypothetical protein